MPKVKKQKNKHLRPSWDKYFLNMAQAVAERATCDRGRSGCVIVRDRQILTTGYVGSAKGLPHCDEAGHEMKKVIDEDGKISLSLHCVRTIHAEQNAICQAARLGIALEGASIYMSSMEPCAVCAKMIINTGIKRVVAPNLYHSGEETRKLFKKAGVKLEVLSKEVEHYAHQ